MDTTSEIASEIRALSAHFPRRRLSSAEFERWITDFVVDLTAAGWSPADVRLACAGWRGSDAKKMPSPGELIAQGRKMTGEAIEATGLPITVPHQLHADMVEACGRPYADSYLSGARVELDELIPKTSIAKERLAGRQAAMEVIERHGLRIPGAARVERDPQVAQQLVELAAQLGAGRSFERRPNESQVAQAERLWPSHRLDRMQAAGRL